MRGEFSAVVGRISLHLTTHFLGWDLIRSLGHAVMANSTGESRWDEDGVAAACCRWAQVGSAVAAYCLWSECWIWCEERFLLPAHSGHRSSR
jgi:hypothetical protein